MMSLGCAGLRCRALLLVGLSLAAVMSPLRVAAQSSDSVRTALLLPGLEGRPFVVWEIQPLTGARRAMKEGAVGLDGRMALSWPADGALRFFRVDCAGSTWTVPVAEAWPAGTRLVPAPPGRAPFARRPGTLQLGNGQGDRTVERLAAFESAMEEVESDAAVEWQRQWLMGDAARGGETEALGDRIGESENSGDAMPMETIGVGRRLDSLQSVAALGAAESVVDYIEALRWRTTLDLPGTDMDAARLEWQSLVAPDVSSQSASLRFAEGALRFATEETWPDTLVQRHKKALDQGGFDALVSTTANWWGGADPAKTEAWLLMRFARDGFGVRMPSEPFADRRWPAGLSRLLEILGQRAGTATELRLLQSEWRNSGVIPSTLRCFDQREELVRIEDVVGSGPALWLWVDAAAPSTTVQVQVLERMIRELRNGPRDFTWVVADAGSDWSAFQAMHDAAVARAGSVKRVPYEMVHVGSDIRWTEAFDLSVLPSVRHHGADVQPTPRDLPLPGPELSRWLARQP